MVGGAASGQKIDVIIRATDSAYWQTLLAGAEAAATDFGVTVGTFGPTSETDIAGQVQLVENSVSRGVDAIVIAPSSSEALNASIDAARKAGIKVITADTKVTADIEGHIGTNNKLAGTQAGQHMCELLTAAGKTTGKVLVEAPIAGIEANQDRDAGFRAGLGREVPGYRLVAAELQQQRHRHRGIAGQRRDRRPIPTWSGVFADNNSSGVGAATAIKDNNAADKIPVVAFDSDPAENAALAAGTIDALVVQNPYFLGYQGVVEAAMATQGGIPPAVLDPGAVPRHQGQHDRSRRQGTARAADGAGRGMSITQAGRAGRPGTDRRLQGIRTGAGAQQRVPQVGSRPGALPGRGERRREVHPDQGSHRSTAPRQRQLRHRGPPVTTATPAALRAAGVQAVYQELSLLPHLSVGENMFMGRLPSRSGMVRSGDLRSRCRTVLDQLGLDDVSPDTIVERLPAATKQLVEIAKVLTADSVKVIVFDEPTTALTESESDRLLEPRSAASARRASPCSTSPTGWRRCSRSATGSPSCATAACPRAARCRTTTRTSSSPRWSAGRCPSLYPDEARETRRHARLQCPGSAANRGQSSRGFRRTGRRNPRHRRPSRLRTQRIAAVHLRIRTHRRG